MQHHRAKIIEQVGHIDRIDLNRKLQPFSIPESKKKSSLFECTK